MKMYHVSPRRLRVGTIISRAAAKTPTWEDRVPAAFASPVPVHNTVWEAALLEGGHLYEVIPVGRPPHWGRMWSEWQGEFEVVKYLGSARAFARRWLKSQGRAQWRRHQRAKK